MNSLLIIGVAIHVVASLMVSVRGPVQTSGTHMAHAMIAYIGSLVINLCGFWPITLGAILFI